MGKGKMYIAQDIQELVDQVVSMHARAPHFKGSLPHIDRDYRFRQLKEGLAANRAILGEERFHALMNLSNEAQTFFEVNGVTDPEIASKGREMFVEMFNILRPDGNMTED